MYVYSPPPPPPQPGQRNTTTHARAHRRMYQPPLLAMDSHRAVFPGWGIMGSRVVRHIA